MTNEEVVAIHKTVSTENPFTYYQAANLYLEIIGSKERVFGEANGRAALDAVFLSLLNTDQYVQAALLAWGDKLFNPLPRSVRMIWGAIESHRKVMAMGSSAQGKSYSACAWAMLRWARDPKYTTVKLISTTGGHAKGNIFSTMVRFHKESIVKLPGIVRDEFIGLSTNDLHSAISKVAIQKGDSGTASLRGFHPLPRPESHPVFGDMSYSIAILDEAEDIPWGVWKGVDNIASTRNVLVYAATNPIQMGSEFANRAAPVDGGWATMDREDDEEWEGNQSWHVIRLDAAKSENVVQKKEVYQGFMSYDGFKDYEKKGLNDPDYDSFARGRYPLQTAQYNIIPVTFLDKATQSYRFTELPENIASLDPAFAEGGDEAILTTGRFGLANGVLENGVLVESFPDRKVLQIEQQFPIQKGNTEDMAENVKEICTNLHVRPEWFVMDCTGNATGLRDLLLRRYGPILHIMWGEGATDKKILEEDTQTADELYSGIDSEMWFAFARWLEFGYVKISPALNTEILFPEMTNRKYYYASKTLRKAENKESFKKSNGGKSCDRTDSAIMSVHICRVRGMDRPAMSPEEAPKPDRNWRPEQRGEQWGEPIWGDEEDSVKYIDFE